MRCVFLFYFCDHRRGAFRARTSETGTRASPCHDAAAAPTDGRNADVVLHTPYKHHTRPFHTVRCVVQGLLALSTFDLCAYSGRSTYVFQPSRAALLHGFGGLPPWQRRKLGSDKKKGFIPRLGLGRNSLW